MSTIEGLRQEKSNSDHIMSVRLLMERAADELEAQARRIKELEQELASRKATK